MGVSYAYSLASTLYNDVEQRPEMVKQGLTRAGIEKVRSLQCLPACASLLNPAQPAQQVLGSKEIERLAGWSTRAGLTTEIAGVKEVAAPYMEMNTKELVLEGAKLVKKGGVEGAKLVNASILQPSYARVDEGLLQPAKARATPYVAPYIARGLDTKDAVLSDVRVQKAVASLKGKFAQVRERPADVARELKTQTIDLIKYEKLGEYRAYVCSEHFVADTCRLIKDDLPALAKEATRLGAHGVQVGAPSLPPSCTPPSHSPPFLRSSPSPPRTLLPPALPSPPVLPTHPTPSVPRRAPS